jgi:hypothetical protein
MRRYAFQVLRKKVKEKHTAPYIDDFIVAPEHLVKFLPELRKIIKKYKRAKAAMEPLVSVTRSMLTRVDQTAATEDAVVMSFFSRQNSLIRCSISVISHDLRQKAVWRVVSAKKLVVLARIWL